jgi:hypothetical protein
MVRNWRRGPQPRLGVPRKSTLDVELDFSAQVPVGNCLCCSSFFSITQSQKGATQALWDHSS